MTQNIKLSVIVPVYNTPEPLLCNCLNSLIKQDGDDLEFIILNDGSTDKICERIIKEFALRDSRLYYIYKNNSGVSDTRNVGLSYAKGKYIMFVDGDDRLTEHACRYAINLIEKDDYDCVIGGFESTNIRKKIRYINHVISGEDLSNFLVKIVGNDTRDYCECGINVDSPWAKIFRKEVIDRNRVRFPRHLSRCEDAMFCLLYYEHSKKILLNSHAIYIYVTNEDSLCRKCSDLSIRMLPLVFKEFRKYSITYHLDDERFQSACIRIAYSLLIEAENLYFFNHNNKKPLIELVKEYKKVLNSFPIKEYRHTINFKILFPHLNPYHFLCWKSDLYLSTLIIMRLKNKFKKTLKLCSRKK